MRRLLLLFLIALPGWGATKLQLHNFGAPVSGYLHASSQQGALLATSVTPTVSSMTSIQAVQFSGGTLLTWISPKLAVPVTISGTQTFNTWGKEHNGANNASLGAITYKYSQGSVSAALCTANVSTELTTSITNKSATCTPTSTFFQAGDRIVITVFVINVGVMGSDAVGVTMDFDGKTGAADGDTYVQFTENLSFIAEPELIQTAVSNGSSTNTFNLSVSSTGLHHTFVVNVAGQSNTNGVASVTDNRAGGSNTYTLIPGAHATVNKTSGPCASTTGFLDTLYVPDSLSGATTITVTLNNTAADAEMWFSEWSGLANTSPLDSAAIAVVNDQVATGSVNQPGPSITPTTGVTDLTVAADYLTSQVQNATNPWAIGAAIANGNGIAYTLAKGSTYQPNFISNTTGDCYAVSTVGLWQLAPLGGPVFVMGTGGYTNTGTTVATNATMNLATGNAVLVGVGAQTSSQVTITDTAGNTFTRIVDQTGTGTNRVSMFCLVNATGNSSDTFTASWTGSSSYSTIFAYQFSGANHCVSPGQTGASASGTAIATGSFTISANTAIVGMMEGDGVPSSGGTGFSLSSDTLYGGTGYEAAEYGFFSSNNTANATQGSSAAWVIGAAAVDYVAPSGSVFLPIGYY